MMMFCTVLPSAATMPIASTNSGNAMMVSAMRDDDAVGPAAEEAGRDAGKPAHQEDERHREHRDDEIEPCRRDHAAEHVAAELIGAEPVRARGRLERHRGVAGERIVGNDVRPEQSREHDQHEQAEREARHRVLADHVARVLERRQDAGGGRSFLEGEVAHPSSLTRGSITP